MTESSPPSQPQDPAPAAPPEAKKGLSPLAWVLIILGVVFVLMMGACVACGLVVTQAARELASDFEANPAKAMAELAVRANPDIELVESDDDAGTMTVRNTETGEELTLNFEDTPKAVSRSPLTKVGCRSTPTPTAAASRPPVSTDLFRASGHSAAKISQSGSTRTQPARSRRVASAALPPMAWPGRSR